ncbi:MAG: hypothetical protein KatS3mg090_0262 [Patescibacteria group bacterium]|nr:MAG: hypothetical protein KatS3mg090_0262 [Patescibacteria group bacterium]
MHKIILSFVIVLCLFITGYIFISIFNQPSETSSNLIFDTKIILPNKKVILAHLADTREEQIQGLSKISDITYDQGMLFKFNEPGFYEFWMKDMLFSLDIVWISSDFEIIDITENAKPESFPETFSSKQPALYVLEVKAGFVKKNNIKVGDKLKIIFP